MLQHAALRCSARRPSGARFNLYLERNRGREVITADLERAIEEATGRSMAPLLRAVGLQGGTPGVQRALLLG